MTFENILDKIVINTIYYLQEVLFYINKFLHIDFQQLFEHYNYISYYFYILFLVSIGTYIGYSTHIVMYKLKIYHGYQGVLYYDNAHLKLLNRIIHTVFMPITTIGILLCAPATININKDDLWQFYLVVYISYITHYLYFDKITPIIVSLQYLPSVIIAYKLYLNLHPQISLIYGLIMSITSLLIQESFGHFISGDIPSRPEGVVNAIFYAVYSSSYTIKLLLESCLTCRNKINTYSNNIKDINYTYSKLNLKKK